MGNRPLFINSEKYFCRRFDIWVAKMATTKFDCLLNLIKKSCQFYGFVIFMEELKNT